ncbi:MAG: hypothetical protein ACR652_24340 [Methylocystis sp.]|uniref:hypothetical protein n=1 Tax=Methylocystis sp. TaxID=1911079 RepID=UPI003DA2F860
MFKKATPEKVTAHNKAVDPKTLAKHGASKESAVPPTKAPVRMTTPGSAKAHKHKVPSRGETIKTPNLLGNWSAR